MTRRALPDDAILIVGAGYLGRRVLHSHGLGAAIGIGRSAAGPDGIAWDLDGDEPLPLLLPARYRVLYTVPPGSAAEGDARLQRLLETLEPPPDRFVYISTTGVYGDHGGGTVDEATPIDPETTRATRRVAAENLLQRWADQSGSRLCVLRVPGIYGPGRLGTQRIAAGEPVLREADANPGNRIHVDDLAACCIAALTKPEAAGIFNVGDGDHRSSTWFTREVAGQAGLPAPPDISRADAALRFSPMRLSFLSESRRVDTRRMREVLGVVPRYADPAEGIRASLEEERREGAR